MTPNDQRLKRYLLGQLPEPERDALESQLIVDREQRAEVEAVERDLIDDYVSGSLEADERSNFEGLFLASATRREKVNFARSLAHEARTSPTAHQDFGSKSKSRSWLSRFFPDTRPVLGFALGAAALLIVAGAVWFVMYRQQPSAERAGIENSAPPAVVPISPTPQEASPPDKGHDTEVVTAPNNSNSATSEQRQQQTPSVASFLILPGSVRGSGGGQLLTIPARAQSVKLRLSLEGQPATGAVRAELRRQSADGELVWRTRNVRAQRSSLGPFVLMELPADKLPAGKYTALIKGAGDVGPVETLYTFSVTRK